MSKKTKNANPDANGEANPVKKRRKHKKLRMLIAISIAVALCGAGLGVGLLFIPKDGLNINEGYASVSYAVEEGETYRADANYSGLDIFGRLNWTFQQQDEWYASFHSMVSTTVDQDVRTLKQFRRSDGTGILISADISRSSLVNLARQFCYIMPEDGTGGRVIWREASGGPSTYNGFDTPWETGEPKGNMTVGGPDGFKAKNGLPATELSVYIFRSETMLDTGTVVQNADGTYTVTYHLNPEVWEAEDGTTEGAAAYYCNQMKFTGGLTDVPSFDEIEVSFTFNENWEVLKTTIHEEYTATMGFTVGCSADSVTEYSYTTPFAPISNAYEEYFKEYADKDATGAPEPTIDNMGALTAAFAPVINGPTTLSLDLTVNGKPVEGHIYIDLHTNGALPSFSSAAGIADFLNKLEVRAKLGNVGLYVQGGAAYLSAGDIKVKLTLGELADLLGGLFVGSDAEGGAQGEAEGADPLAALMDAELVHEAGSGKASAHAELDLGAVVIPIDFNYFIDEATLAASLDNVQTAFSLQDIALSARLGYSAEAAPAPLTGTGSYSELSTHIQNLIKLFGSEVFHADVAYEGYGLTVGGGIDIAVKGDLKVSAALTVGYGKASKQLGIAYEKGMFYLDLDGVKLSAKEDEAAALIKEFLPQTQAETEAEGFSLSSLIDTLLFTSTLTDNIAVSGNETSLQILLKADELLKAFGFDLGGFELGTVKLGVAGKQLTLEALSARLTVKEGAAFQVETDGYSDVMYYVQELMGLFGSELLHADVAYEGNGLEVTGGLDLNVNELIAAAELTVAYGEAEKQLNVIYSGDVLYLNIDGLKFSANAKDAVALVQAMLGSSASPAALGGDTAVQLEEILTLLFSFRFGDVLTVGDTEIAVDGTKLLAALGADFALGGVTLTVEEQQITAKALGATVTVKAGAPFTAEAEGYTDVLDYAAAVAQIVQGGYLTADVTYSGYGLDVTGTVGLNINERIAEGNFTLVYGEAEKQLAVIYKNDRLYLNADGLKLSADASSVISIVQGILGANAEGSAQNQGAADVLTQLFSFRFSDLITMGEEGTTLGLAVEGTELLKAFGIDFELGQVTLGITKEGEITVKALGATLAVRAGAPFTAATKGYVDIMDYANTVAELIGGNYLIAGVKYSGYGLEIEGRVNFDIHELIAKGNFAVAYGEAVKMVSVIYKEDVVYIEVDGLKLSANVKDAVALVQGMLGAEEPAAPTAEDPAAGEEAGVKDILTKLFSFRFSDLITMGEEGRALNLSVKGTELLKVFGINFELGDVDLQIRKGGTLIAEALGATLTVKSGSKFAVSTSGYTDIGDYAAVVAQLIKGGYLKADVSYSGYGLEVTGTVGLDINNLVAQGTFTVAYGAAEKQISVIYQNNIVYLDVEGLKFSADVNEAVAFVQGLLGTAEPAALADEGVADILATVFSVNFGDMVTVGEEGTTLNLFVKGTELLKLFGIDFALGGVDLAITKEGTVAAKAADLGVAVEIAAGAPFTPVTDGYVAILDYAAAVAQLIEGGYLAADLTYEGNGLTVTGGLDLNINDLVAQGTFTLTYGALEKTVEVIYKGDNLYLKLDGLKLSVNAKQAVSIVQGMLGAAEPAALADDGVADILAMVFSVNFGNILTVGEEGTTLNLTVKGTELLKALGVEFSLGDVALSLTKAGTIAANAADLGVSVGLRAGTRFTAATSGYTDVTPVLAQLPAVLNAKALALKGTIFVLAGDTEIALKLNSGVFAWGEGINLFLDADLNLGTSVLPVMLHITDSEVQANICGMGMQLAYSDLPMLENAILSVYRRIRDIISEMLVEGTANPLPEIGSFEDLLNLLKGTAVAAAALEGAAEQAETSFDWTELLQNIVIGASDLRGGIAHAEYQGVNVDLLNQIGEGGFIGLVLGYAADTFSVTADLGVTVYTGEFPEIPAPDLTAAEVENFLGYIGSAIELFETTDLTLTFEGKVTSSDTAAYPPAEGEEYGTKYNIQASMSTHRGARNLIHLDVDGNHLWVDADVFAHASINVMATNPADTSIYIDLFILDGAPAKAADGSMTYTQDGMLDFYVTLSQFGDVGSTAETVTGYNPVRLYAPSQEILTILSSALPMFGIDVEILNNYMVNYWLSLENVAQLKAFGSLLSPLLAGLLGGTEAAPAALAEADAPAGRKTISVWDYLSALEIGKEELNIELNSQTIYGIDGLDNVQAILTKDADEKDENGNYTYGQFHTLDLLNIYDKTGTLDTSLKGTVSYGAVDTAVPVGDYQSFLGADKLILSLVKSATHGVNENGEIISGEAEPHHYVVNNNFYIDGSATIAVKIGSFTLEDVEIKIIAVSVSIDEEGKLALNLRLEYDGVQNGALALAGLGGIDLGTIIINGKSTVDLTLKDGMVYMKRVQYTWYRESILVWEAGWQTYKTPITLYRAMPVANFTANIFDQLGFLFNIGDQLWTYINEQINNSSSSGGETTPAEKIDFGQRLQDVLKSYTFVSEVVGDDGSVTTPASWNLVLNGDALAKGVLGDLTVTLNEDMDGYFHDITANTSIIGLITADISLRWRNPGGAMEEGATDQTHDITEEVADENHGFGGMVGKLNAESGWFQTLEDGTTTGVTFLEGQQATVTYNYRDYAGAEAFLGTQNVLVSTGADGQPANTLYSALSYPELPEKDAQFEYDPLDVSAPVGEVLDPLSLVIGKQILRHYNITFYTKDEALGRQFGWAYDEAQSRYFYEQDMQYGAPVEIGGQSYTVTGIHEFEIVAAPESEDGRVGTWQGKPEISGEGAKFTATYPASVIYHSEVQFALEGHDVTSADGSWNSTVEFDSTEYTLLTPSASGYTFLGWFVKEEDGWKAYTTLNASEVSSVTVEALWAESVYGFTMSGRRDNEGGLFTPSYKYSITIAATEERLVGAFANEQMERSVKREFYIGTETPGYVEGAETSYSNNLGNTSGGVNAYARVTVTYVDGNGNTLWATVVEHRGSFNRLGSFTQQS